MRRIRRPLAYVGVAAGSLGLSLGLGMAVASAATTPTTTTPSHSGTTTPPRTAPAPGTPGHRCPGMGGDSHAPSTGATTGLYVLQ